MWTAYAAIVLYLIASGLLLGAVVRDKVAASRAWLWPALGGVLLHGATT